MSATVSAEALPESDHDYANNFDYMWPAITEPDATQMRLHLTQLDLAGTGDYLMIYDTEGSELVKYNYLDNDVDMWTEWFTGDTLKVSLKTSESDTAYGFSIDQIETRTDMSPSSDLPESYHDYANNFEYTWPAITEPDATQMRLHLTQLDLAGTGDYLIIYDTEGSELVKYNYLDNDVDMWTEWFTGDTLKVSLKTGESGTAYGFKIDNIDTRREAEQTEKEPEYAQTEESEYAQPQDTEYTQTENLYSSSSEGDHSQPESTQTKESEYTQPESTEYTQTEYQYSSLPEEDRSTPPSASVNLHGEKTDVILGEEVLLKLSAVNIIGNPTMHVQVIIIPPSGCSVTSSEFVESGAGQYTAIYDVEPSDGGKDIEIWVKPNQVGEFEVEGKIFYYFGDDVSTREDHTLKLPMVVRPGYDLDSEGSDPIPGFTAIIVVLLLLITARRFKN